MSQLMNGKPAAAAAVQPPFNGRELSAYLKQSWSSLVEASNNPALPASEKPEMFRAPAGPGGAWASGAGGAWGASRANAQRDQQMADGQPFLVGLARAVDAQRRQQQQQQQPPPPASSQTQSQPQSQPKQSKK